MHHETKYFFQNRRTHGTFRIDDVSEPDASSLTAKHVNVDRLAVVDAHGTSSRWAIRDAIFQRLDIADRCEEVLSLKSRPGKAPALHDVDL